MYHLHYINKKLFRMIFTLSGKVDYRLSVLLRSYAASTIPEEWRQLHH